MYTCMHGKYVVLKKEGEEIAVLLPPKAHYAAALFMFGTNTSDVVSAGRFDVTAKLDGTVDLECYGDDVELDARALISSRGDVDAQLLRALFTA